MEKERLEIFERAFSGHAGSCRRQCECGREFYNPDAGGWSWEDGELEALERNPNATALDYSVGVIEVEGHMFVPDCDCWHARALNIMRWLTCHAEAIAEYFKLERERRMTAAAKVPEITL